jgi:hypothetical protein
MQFYVLICIILLGIVINQIGVSFKEFEKCIAFENIFSQEKWPSLSNCSFLCFFCSVNFCIHMVKVDVCLFYVG